MYEEFSDELIMLRDMVRKMAIDKLEPVAGEIDETGVYPQSHIELFKELDLMGVAYPEDCGGSGMGVVGGCIVMEEIAKVCGNSAMVIVNTELACTPIMLGGTKEQKEKFVVPCAKGDWRASLALTEPDAGSDAAGVKTRAVKDGNEYVINGSKRFISYSDVADMFVVVAKTDPNAGTKGLSAFIVEAKTPGLTVGKAENKCGFKGYKSCEVYFDDVRVPAENIIDGEGKGFKWIMKTLDKTRPMIAAIGVGLAQGCLDAAIDYAKTRVQFGQPIASFQGLQWMMADMFAQIEAARNVVFKAARMADAGDPKLPLYASIAKLLGTEAAMKVSTDSIQVVGGSGYMKDYPLERRFREAKLLQIVEGTNQIQKVVIAANILA